MDIGKAITELNASYEETILKHVVSTDAKSVFEIDLAEPFLGVEWGITEWNLQRQKWRWLGPRGESHLFLKLATSTDHLIRVSIHTAASGQIIEALTAFVNGTPCVYQGHDWGAGGAVSHWCIVDREMIAERQGIAKITWSVLPAGETQQRLEAQNQPGHLALARSIAFSRIVCEPYPLPEGTPTSEPLQAVDKDDAFAELSASNEAASASVQGTGGNKAITEPYTLTLGPSTEANEHDRSIASKLRRALGRGLRSLLRN